MNIRKVLVIPHIFSQNSNASSGVGVVGFPQIPAWLGLSHSLQRLLRERGYLDIRLKSIAIVCHDFKLHVFKGVGDYVSSIISTGNPLDETGERSSFIEEARCNLEVSLAIEFEGVNDIDQEDTLCEHVKSFFYGKLKIAGGDILSLKDPYYEVLDGDDKKMRKILRKLMPGYALLSRKDLMLEGMKEVGKDAMDVLLDHIKIMNNCSIEDEDNDKFSWISHRKVPGWIVPIVVGYQGITDLAEAKNQREKKIPHRFAENVFSLGEFVMPIRVTDIDQILWKYSFDQENDLYLCEQCEPYVVCEKE